MKNAETPTVKVVLYGAMASLGGALMAELLRRQHEVIAILDDLNVLAPRPGLRTKSGDLFDAERVNQSVAGSSAVICLLDAPGLPFSSDQVERAVVLGPVEQAGDHTAGRVHARLEAHRMKMPAHQLAGIGKCNLAERSPVHVLPTFDIEPFRQLMGGEVPSMAQPLEWTKIAFIFIGVAGFFRPIGDRLRFFALHHVP